MKTEEINNLKNQKIIIKEKSLDEQNTISIIIDLIQILNSHCPAELIKILDKYNWEYTIENE